MHCAAYIPLRIVIHRKYTTLDTTPLDQLSKLDCSTAARVPVPTKGHAWKHLVQGGYEKVSFRSAIVLAE